jgi:uncharacterized coiled-coil protein SlyX
MKLAKCLEREQQMELELAYMSSTIEEFKLELAEYKRAIEKHNQKMEAVPLRKRPKNLESGLFVLADWFDAVYQDEGENDLVQQDLRRWAREHMLLQDELSECQTERNRLRKALSSILSLCSEGQYWLNAGSLFDRIKEVAAEALKGE